MIKVELQRIACVLLVLKQAQTLYISQGVSAADDATSQCGLAVPPIQYSRQGNTVSLHRDDVRGDLSIYAKLWVGYARIYQAFLYIGCVKRDYIRHVTTHRNISIDPGQCLSICKSPFVGIEEHRCRCVYSSNYNLLDNDCDEYCDFPPGVSCGKKGEAASVYKPVAYLEGAPGEDNGDHLCRVFDPVQNRYLWKKCRVPLNLACQQGSYTNPDAAVYVQTESSKQYGWHDNMRRCIKTDMYPVYEGVTANIRDKYGLRWTGVIRSYVITETSKTERTKPGFQQGYIVNEGGTFRLEFDHVGALYALCNDSGRTATSSPTLSTTTTDRPSTMSTGPDNINTTSQSTLHTNGPTVTDNPSPSSMIPDTGKINSPSSSYTTATTETNKPPSSSTIPVTIPRTNEPTTMANSGRGNANDNASGQTVVYVVVPLLAVSAILVAVIVICKKRVQFVEKDAIIPADAVVNAAYQYDDVLEASPADNSSSKIPAFEHCNEYETVDSANVDTTGGDNYDTTTTRMGTCIVNDTGNVYNRLNGDTEDTYNRTNETVDIAGDAYSHVGNNLSTLEYSTTDTLTQLSRNAQVQENYYSSVSNRDDTYNHLNEATSNTDNNVFHNGTYNHTDNEMQLRSLDKVTDVNTYTQTAPTRTIGPHTGSVESDYANT